ncbi:MAG: ABC transporter permease [Anaerolineales bacterium]|nr:ABC transporter permease [Anaerolineales bacterium]
MRVSDLIALILENLGRRKARVALTAVGVVIGTAAVVLLVSLGVGLQRSATQQLGGIGDLTRIDVYPVYGEPGGGGGIVVMEGPGGVPGIQQPINDQTLEQFAAMPGVTAVIARDWVNGGMMLNYGRLEGYGSIMGLGTDNAADLGVTAEAGTLTLSKGTAVIGAMVPQQFFDPRVRPGQEPPPPPDLLGQTLKATLIKYSTDGVEIRKMVQVRVVGVMAESRGEADWSIYMPLSDVTAYNEWFLGKRINRQKDGYANAVVKVGDVDQVLDVADQINELGFQASTPQSFVQGINSFFIVLQVVFGGVGAIALLVAAIGIANTMAMAILERTREIGLMKAVGATNRDVLSVFLGEAAGIGFIGGLGGVALGWSAGQIINVLALAYLAGQSAQSGAPPPTEAVFTPVWLPIFSLVFATLIGVISGLYPALRAATLVPVNALKYE